MSVKRCKEEVDSREFTAWLAYYEFEPYGPRDQLDLLARGFAILANLQSSEGGWDIEDFLAAPPRDLAETSGEQISGQMEALSRSWKEDNE